MKWLSTKWKQIHTAASARALPYILSALMASVVVILYAKAFRFCEEFHKETVNSWPWYLNLAATLILFTLSWWLPFRFEKFAGSSGIPQMLAADELEGSSRKTLLERLVGVKTIVVKIAGSLLAAIGGAAAGIEGPTLQICAGVFHNSGKLWKRLFSLKDQKNFILAGSAAGLSAAFNTPLGGIVYALEELAKEHFSQFRSMTLLSVITAGILVQAVMGPYLFLGYPEVEPVLLSAYPEVILLAVAGGLAGALFGVGYYKIFKFRSSIQSTWKSLVITLVAGLGFWYFATEMSAMSFGSGKSTMMALLFANQQVSAIDILGRFIGPLLMALAGVTGGIFAPSLTIGAVIGMFGATHLTSSFPHLLVLVTMVSFLAGLVRTPFTCFVLVIEMTDRHSAIFPLMLAAVIGYGVAKLIERKSFYDKVKEEILSSD